MKLQIKKGTTSRMVEVFVQDSSSTVGAGLTGLVHNSAGLTAYYYLNDAASTTAITLATMTLGTFTSGGFIVVDATNMPGLYSIGLPDAALTGADSVVVYLKGATNMAPVVLEIELVNYDPQDSVRMGMTALPNAAADAAGGLPISDAGGLDLDAIKTKTDFLPSATAGAAGGVFIAGTNAPVTITGSGDALTLTSTGANGSGMTITAHGTGIGLDVTGGSTSGNGARILSVNGSGLVLDGGVGGSGLSMIGGSSGAGFTATGGSSSGPGALFQAGASGNNGLTITGLGAGNGLDVTGGSTGAGIAATGGVTSGHGLVVAGDGNGAGINATGTGGQAGIVGSGNGGGGGIVGAGGATGAGIVGQGGITSGDGIRGQALTNGRGLYAIGVGQADIEGDITGDITGTLATLTTYTGNTVQTGDAFARLGAAGAGLTDLGGMSTAMKAEVNAEVVDVIDTDTSGEPGQGTPAATTTLREKIDYLYKNWRNKKEQTSTVFSLYDDAGTTVDQKSTVADNGTTASKAEMVTGP